MFIELKIYKPEKILDAGKMSSVRLPGSVEPFELFPLHAPIISTLKQGTIYYQTDEGVKQQLAIDQGIVEVTENQAKVYLI